MADTKISAQASGAPAQLADILPVGRAGSPLKLTVQEVLTALTLLAAGTPAAATDEFLAVRAGVAKKLTLAEILAPRHNFVTNGCFEVAQRGASYALTTAATYGSVDMWAAQQDTVATAVFTQSTQAPTGFKNSARLWRNSGSTGVGILRCCQAFESIDSRKLQGRNVMLSFQALAGNNFSAAGSLLGFVVRTGTGADETAVLLNNAGWTGNANPINSTQAITGAWTRYQFSGTIAANATQVGVVFYFTPVGTAGADDSVYITDVDLSVTSGTGALAEQRHYSQELAMCQRTYERCQYDLTNLVCGTGYAASTTSARVTFPFKVKKRIPPTFSSSLATNFIFQNTAGNTALTALAASSINTDTAQLDVTVAAGLTAGQSGALFNTNAGSFIAFDCNL